MNLSEATAVGGDQHHDTRVTAPRVTAGWPLGLGVPQAVLAGVSFLVLGDAFGFPDVLREPAAVVLPRFQENVGTIRRAYDAFALSALLAIPIAVLVRGLLGRRDATLLTLATTFGVASGVAPFLGFFRRPISVPYFAATYADPATGAATRAAAAIAFGSLNRGRGMAIGEHLGWLMQGSWLPLLGVVLLRNGALPRWLGGLGVLIGAGLLAATPERFRAGGEEFLELPNDFATTAAQFWLIALALVLFLRARRIEGER